MGWYIRNSRKYYAHVYRDSDGRLRSVYYGVAVAEEAAAAYDRERTIRLGRAARLRDRRGRLRADERRLINYCKNVNKLHDAWRRAAGWYFHPSGSASGGSWRRVGPITRRTLMKTNVQSFDEAARQRAFAAALAEGDLRAAIERFGGDPAKLTADMIISNITDEPIGREAMRLKVARLRAELEGTDASAVVSVMAERVSICYLDSYYADMLSNINDEPELMAFLQARQTSALRRLTSAIKALAETRQIEAETIGRTVRRLGVVG
jgi:hypothetical protein